ncbi:CDK5 regulatory subunit-associated protein 3 [Trichinella pseudospiralis]|uniref:CDK5 regulatory subunit-associated protein 3 n=1 Tax=Trichinella pseudospiralis TaxID=6337 RepID=A0A0V1IIZ1_TRIPS|nr:CDK5 regulatory subunit-associated protein 3 [Trichinella pseudospiralis]KRZ22716.1 CDK5 regulatory subunit-associated protein 3 [Trichinella pseudospiralis]
MTDISTLPIDIHCSKLLDWLRSRRHIKSEWPQKLSQIRQLISSAIGDMPENDEIATLLSNASLLTTTEADTKNIFGRYSSQRMKDWQNIIAKYEEDNVYLAEIASLLVDLAQYQIPGFKKRISRLEATIQLEKQVDKNEDEIDFGDDLFETEAMQSADYGIEEIAVVDDKNLKDSNCKSHPNVEESVARGEEALTVLENVFTNALLLTELLELKSFFKMRHHELNTDHFASELLFANDSVRLLANGMSFVEKWLQATEQIIQKLQDPVLCHLTELRSKAEYLEYLSSEIYSHKERTEKCRQTVDALNNRQKDATKEIQQLLEEIQNLAAIARDLKSFIEQNISKRYNNRKVNIVGSTVTI